jgi:hypothetical protein
LQYNKIDKGKDSDVIIKQNTDQIDEIGTDLYRFARDYITPDGSNTAMFKVDYKIAFRTLVCDKYAIGIG